MSYTETMLPVVNHNINITYWMNRLILFGRLTYVVLCQEQVLKWAMQDTVWLNLMASCLPSSNKCTGTCWLARPGVAQSQRKGRSRDSHN